MIVGTDLVGTRVQWIDWPSRLGKVAGVIRAVYVDGGNVYCLVQKDDGAGLSPALATTLTLLPAKERQ